MNTKKIPVGISDFKSLIEENFYYVDKTGFIKDVVNSSSQVLLLPRPRRFGKTLNLSMLKYFFEKSDEDRTGIFNKLMIQNDPIFKTCHGKYPVIFMTFKDVKHSKWKRCFSAVKEVVRKEFARHRYLLESNILYSEEKKYIQKVLFSELEDDKYEVSLNRLSDYLYRYYQEKVIILIDEYDTPIHAAYQKGYYEQLIEFIRNFLSDGLKDNQFMFKSVLTGILRVAKESVFSGLNNLGVYTLLDKEFNTCFGFTEKEVKSLLEKYEISDRYDDIVSWYNGYLFGGEVIYNPWSVVQFIHRQPKIPSPYWVNTADTGMIDRLATRDGRKLREEIGQLLEGKSTKKQIYDSIVMKDLEKQDNLLWSFLLFSGYLKIVGEKCPGNNYWLAVPNQEVCFIYEEMVKRWFWEKVESDYLEQMTDALKKGDAKLFEIMLRKIVLQVMSYHDLSGEPEKVYHALVLGMLVWMSQAYDIRSNRESGYGRYDIMLKPRDLSKHGIIIEFKMVNDEETPKQTLERAMKQIERKKYTTELEAAGIKNILKIAIAFQGKELWIDHTC